MQYVYNGIYHSARVAVDASPYTPAHMDLLYARLGGQGDAPADAYEPAPAEQSAQSVQPLPKWIMVPGRTHRDIATKLVDGLRQAQKQYHDHERSCYNLRVDTLRTDGTNTAHEQTSALRTGKYALVHSEPVDVFIFADSLDDEVRPLTGRLHDVILHIARTALIAILQAIGDTKMIKEVLLTTLLVTASDELVTSIQAVNLGAPMDTIADGKLNTLKATIDKATTPEQWRRLFRVLHGDKPKKPTDQPDEQPRKTELSHRREDLVQNTPANTGPIQAAPGKLEAASVINFGWAANQITTEYVDKLDAPEADSA